MDNDKHEADFSRLLGFLRAPTSFHAVERAVALLEGAGFSSFSGKPVSPGEKKYILKEGSIAVIAAASEPVKGWRIVAAHTDSPNLRIKPVPAKKKSGYPTLNVEVYGGVLLSTWLDRDLGMAGVVYCKVKNGLKQVLVDSESTVASIPNLAIHLNRGVNESGLVINPRQHLSPLVWRQEHEGFDSLLRRLCGEPDAAVVDWDLSLYDRNPACIEQGVVTGARLDNLVSCEVAINSLIESQHMSSPYHRVAILFDHEECGSTSATGARSNLVRIITEQLLSVLPEGGLLHGQDSCLLSLDAAHAVHPNYSECHDEDHHPLLGKGIVLKTNVNQAYATTGLTRAAASLWAERCGIETQYFVSRNDFRCGSTVGPSLSASLGMRSVDVGVPMLAMHSIRELAHTRDIKDLGAFTKVFLQTPLSCNQ